MKRSKSNTTWKRVAAGALSLALVVGAMPANVGGLLTGGNGLVARATVFTEAVNASDLRQGDIIDANVLITTDNENAIHVDNVDTSWIKNGASKSYEFKTTVYTDVVVNGVRSIYLREFTGYNLNEGTDYTAPTAVAGLSYDGEEHALVTGGGMTEAGAAKGTMQYALGKVITSDINFNDLAVNDILKISNDSSLTISNINSIVLSEITYQSNGDNVITISDDDYLFFNGTQIAQTNDGGAAIKVTGINREQGIVYVQQVAENADLEWSTNVPNATNVGDYCVSWRITGAENYNDVAPQTITATIAKGTLAEKHIDATTQEIVGDYTAPTAAKTLKTAATDTEPAEYYDDLFYTGENQALINAGSVDGGKGTMQYILGTVHTINENTTINGEDICPGDIFYFPANVNSAAVTISGEAPNFEYNYARLYKEGGYVVVEEANGSGSSSNVNYYNCIYVYTMSTSEGPKYNFGTGYYNPETGVLTSSIDDTEDKRNWSESVPTGNKAGKYNIAWRIAGNDNYNPVGGVIENEIKVKTAPVLLSNLDGAVITKADGTVLAANDTGNYTVTGGKYYLYTDKTVAGADTTSSIAKLVGKNQTLDTTTYVNKYEFTIPTLPADNGYTFSHTNNWSGSVPKSNESQLYVADGDVNVTDPSQLAAVLQSTGTFYYGDQPSAANVVINDGFGSIVLVEDVYLSNDQGTKLDLTSGNVAYGNYKLTAKVTIDSDGDGDLETGTLKTCTLYANVVYAARPMSENKCYLVTANPDFDAEQVESETNKPTIETPLEVIQDLDEDQNPIEGKYHVEVPADTFSYDGKEKAPVIKFINPGNGDVLTEKNYAVKAGETQFKATNAGDYSYVIEALPSTEATADTAAFVNNYVKDITVQWHINKAKVAASSIVAEANNDIVYDAEVLKTADDFTFKAKLTEGSDPKPVDPNAAALLADSATVISEPTFGYTPAESEYVGNEFEAIAQLQSSLGIGGNAETILNQINNDYVSKLPNKFVSREWGIWAQSTEDLAVKISYNGAAEIDIYQMGIEGTELKYLTSEDEGDPIVLATLEEGEYFQIAAATLDTTGDVPTIHYVINKTPTDGKSAGLHKATFTITNPNYEDITIKDVDAPIAKRKVTITPSEENNRVYGYEDVLPSYDNGVYNPGRVLQNELKGELEIAKTKTEGDKTVLDGKTGLIASDANKLGVANDNQALQKLNEAATMFLTIGQEKKTTNKLKPDIGDMFDFDSFINDAGTYAYNIRTPEQINSQIDQWEIAIGGNESQLAICEQMRTLVNVMTSDYEYVLPEGSVFTLEKAPLTKDLFTLDEEAQEELGFELVNGIPTYTFNSGEFFAPKYVADDTTFGDTETKKLNEWDFITGGYQKVLLPGSYTVEFTATPDGNYKSTANVPWNVLSNNDYSQLVEVEDKEYDGNEIEPSIEYYCLEEIEPATGSVPPIIEPVLLDEDEIPDSFKTTYTYYEYDKTKVNDNVPLTIDIIEQMKKLDEAPKDAGKYVVVASTKSKGYNIKDSFDVFEITPIEISITPSVTKKEFGNPDPVITFKNNLDKVRLEGEDNVVLNDVTELKISGRYVDVPGGEPKFVEYDGSVASDWIISLNGLEVNSKNYKLKLTKDTFKVIAHILTDDCIKPTKICVTDETGFADPSSCVEVKTVINGEEYTLVEGTDFEFVSKAQTQELGSYSVQIKGIGNFEGYAETTVEVIGNLSLAEPEDIAKLVKITERKSEPNINPANSKMYVKCGFDVNELAEGIEMVECGIISSSDSKDIPVSELTLENVGKNNIIQRKSSVTNFIDNGKGVSAVGYVIIKDKAGKTGTIYTGNIGGSSVVVTEYEPKQRIKDGKNYVNLGFWVEIDHKDYNVDEYGLLVCNDGTITDVADLTLENAEINSHIDKRVMRSKTNIEDTGKGVIAVGYAKISRADGRTAVIYTNNVGGKYGELPEYQS